MLPAGTGVKLPPGGGYDLPAGGIKLNPFNPLALRCESNASIDDEAVRRQSLAVPAECQFQAKQVYEGQRDRGQALGGEDTR